jgi:hypothetical protein
MSVLERQKAEPEATGQRASSHVNLAWRHDNRTGDGSAPGFVPEPCVV